MKDMAALFDERPVQWGFRGDPWLWDDLQRHFVGRPMPESEAAFEAAFRALFRELTGRELGAVEFDRLEQYAHGGMSSGGIHHGFWQEKVLPLLLERWRAQLGRD